MKISNFSAGVICLLLFAGCPPPVKESSLPFIRKTPVSLTLPTVEGNSYSLDLLRGKIVFVVFFSTWCRPCPILFERLLQVQASFTKDKLQIVAISVDHDPRFLDMYAETLNLPFPILQSTPESLDSAGIGRVRRVPTILLLDTKGLPRVLLSEFLTTREMAELANRL